MRTHTHSANTVNIYSCIQADPWSNPGGNGRVARIAGSRCCHQHLGVGRPTCLKPSCAVLLLVAPCHHRRRSMDEALHPRVDWMPNAPEVRFDVHAPTADSSVSLSFARPLSISSVSYPHSLTLLCQSLTLCQLVHWGISSALTFVSCAHFSSRISQRYLCRSVCCLAFNLSLSQLFSVGSTSCPIVLARCMLQLCLLGACPSCCMLQLC